MKYDIENKVGYVMKPLCARMLLEVCNNKLCKYFLLDMLKKLKSYVLVECVKYQYGQNHMLQNSVQCHWVMRRWKMEL